MAQAKFKIGITRDNLQADGKPFFRDSVLDLLRDPRFNVMNRSAGTLVQRSR